MPRVVKIEFDVAGATTGTQTIPCDPAQAKTGNFNVYLAWDRAEQIAARRVNATIKLATPGLFFFRVLIRNRATPSAADPVVPNFIWPSVYEIIGPLLGWKVTSLLTSYTYSCSTGCILSITSSRGGTWNAGDADESVRGIITLRSGGVRYDRRSAEEVTVVCSDPEEKEVGYLQPPFEEGAYAMRLDRLLERYVIQEAAQTDLQIAEAIQAIVAAYGPPAVPPPQVQEPRTARKKPRKS